MTPSTKSKSAPRRSTAALKRPDKPAALQRKSSLRARNLQAMQFLRELDQATPSEIAEQRETWEFLKAALDEDRLSPHRKFFE